MRLNSKLGVSTTNRNIPMVMPRGHRSAAKCTRPNCGKALPPGRHKYCSQECASAAHQDQLEAITEKRRVVRRQKPPVKCAILTCTGTLIPTNSSHKYCSIECSLKGLQAAIDRQRLRREQDKKIRKEAIKLRKAAKVAQRKVKT